MTRNLLAIFCVLVIVSCKPGIPKDIEQPADIENILHDIHIIDAYLGNISNPDSAIKISAPLYKGIFKKYNTDSAKHAVSMTYYYKHPELLVKMYESISKRLAKEKDAEMAKMAKENKQLIDDKNLAPHERVVPTEVK